MQQIPRVGGWQALACLNKQYFIPPPSIVDITPTKTNMDNYPK